MLSLSLFAGDGRRRQFDLSLVGIPLTQRDASDKDSIVKTASENSDLTGKRFALHFPEDPDDPEGLSTVVLDPPGQIVKR